MSPLPVASSSPSGVRIAGLGHYQPERVVTNAELSTTLETSDEWILSRVGIAERRIGSPQDTVLSMATEASHTALKAASGDVDMVVVATCSAERLLPNTAAQLSAAFELPAPAAIDINTACSGFAHALCVASDAIRAGTSRRALVVGSEKLSNHLDWSDRNTAVIFADGAGAVLLEASSENGIGPVVWGSDGNNSDLIQMRNGFMWQEGRSVFRWAVTQLAPLARDACERAGVKPSEIAAFIPHQANARIISHIARTLGISDERVSYDIRHAGNTSAASIPLAFSRMHTRGDIPPGEPVLLFGFGGGLTYAGQVVLAP